MLDDCPNSTRSFDTNRKRAPSFLPFSILFEAIYWLDAFDCSWFTSIVCTCSHSKHYSIGHGHRWPIGPNVTANRWKCSPPDSSSTRRVTLCNAFSISYATNDTCAMPSNNLWTSARCRTYRCLYLRSMRMAIISMDDHRMVLPTRICVRCCNNYDAKVKTCVAIEDCYPIPNIKHSVFSHRCSYSKWFESHPRKHTK